MESYGLLCRVAAMRTNVSEERIISIIMVKRISEVGPAVRITSQCASVPSYY
jgi:hypothetical protein